MVKVQAFPVVYRISSDPSKMLSQFCYPKSLSNFAGINSVLKPNRQIRGEFLPLGPRYVKNCILNYSVMGGRGLSSSNSQEGGGRSEMPLPWLAASTKREQRNVQENEISKGVRSSWEESAEKFLKVGGSSVEIRETPKFESRRTEFRNKDHSNQDEEEEGGARWDNVRNKFDRFVKVKPEVRKWDSQENWGRKTWKEANESSVPRIVGEGIYGVGAVLAALSAGRREFYALYVQEGLDLSANNRKKKDKKGFEQVLKMAEKIGLSQKEASKHDLNMIVDNRPHQGLVLDASPLEVVGIKELEPVSIDQETGSLWLALDEVTDPQNLGAIIRSAYFFGASGVVLCAKNSARLSGVVSKASAGSLELMELRSCKNMMQFLSSSAENGWRVLGGSVSSRSSPLSKILPGAPTILVLGSEGTGLRPLVERACTQLVRIPGNLPLDVVTTGGEEVESVDNTGHELRSFLAVESLNVSVAAGVLLNHLIGSNYGHTIDLQDSKLV